MTYRVKCVGRREERRRVFLRRNGKVLAFIKAHPDDFKVKDILATLAGERTELIPVTPRAQEFLRRYAKPPYDVTAFGHVLGELQELARKGDRRSREIVAMHTIRKILKRHGYVGDEQPWAVSPAARKEVVAEVAQLWREWGVSAAERREEMEMN